MDYIKIGIIANTYGLKGEVKVKPFTDFVDLRFKKGNTIYVACGEEYKAVKIKHKREHKGLVYLSFAGYDHINLIEAWKGCDLYIPKQDLHELESDEIYFYELKGCEVTCRKYGDLGVVTQVLETGANTVIRVQKDQQQILIPYVKAFIKEVYKEEKKIIVELLEGML